MKPEMKQSPYDLACELASKAHELTGTLTEIASQLGVSPAKLSKSHFIASLPKDNTSKWQTMHQNVLYYQAKKLRMISL